MYAPATPRKRAAVVAAIAAAALLGVGVAGVAAATRGGGGDQAGVWVHPTKSPQPRAEATEETADEEQSISLSATGDIVMGNAPGSLPSNGGKGFFDGVKKDLAADLVMGNLEEPLTDDTGRSKCGPESTGCHQFRAPPGYAKHLKDAGFELLNQANNHGNDYGADGYENTQRALEKYGLQHTGAVDQITVADVEGIKVAVVGFSSYPWNNSLIDIADGKKLVAKAAGQADLVVVQVHMGAEGSGKTRVKPGTEMFLGENRGDPIKFAHSMIDAGADLIVGHGPHVLRAMEFYKGRLIAYSLGNFAGGGGTLSRNGPLGLGAVLKVELTADGTWVDGELVSTAMNSAGKPVTDPDGDSLDMVSGLSKQDFPRTGAEFDDNGKINPPA
ncbi:CapA family protein [Asanoa sp. WMMD1127]|uniref:CapA family protein n=1 Tax=Asanoa sp. WMMD1127 TaxID=3016107 RepID=UPI0024170BA6|nr:CapA family protein [Asanoa sp. WMMD1127]MDG4822389.1 CapA family protein [Asanoa sp. WMMD1127]